MEKYQMKNKIREISGRNQGILMGLLSGNPGVLFPTTDDVTSQHNGLNHTKGVCEFAHWKTPFTQDAEYLATG